MPNFTYIYCGDKQQRRTFPIQCRHDRCEHFKEDDNLTICECIFPNKVKVKKDVVHNKGIVSSKKLVAT